MAARYLFGNSSIIQDERSNILIVEDSEFINHAIKRELEAVGHHCVQAYTLEESLQVLKLMNHCDFIILDLNLPDAYGERLFYALTSQSDAKIIILTSEEDAQVRAALFKAGALDYILKDENFVSSVLQTNNTIKRIAKNRGFNVLTIDDSSLLLKHIEVILTTRNYSVYQAKTGKDGLEYLKNEEINLVLLDLELPDMHGTEILQIIKNDAMTRNIPVLVLSATNNPDYISQVLKGGASDFIQKPFNIEEFVLKIDLWSQLTLNMNEITYLNQLLDEYKLISDQCSLVATINYDGHFTYVNQQLCNLFGRDKEELIGDLCTHIFNTDDLQETHIKMIKTLHDQNHWSGNVIATDNNGQKITLHAQIKAIIDVYGHPIEYMVQYKPVL